MFGQEITRWSQLKGRAGQFMDDHPVATILGIVAVGTAVAVGLTMLSPGSGSTLGTLADPGNILSPLHPSNLPNLIH